jgi:hypothetical protein
MIFLDFCAAILRNRHLARPALRAFTRGCELAKADPAFALRSGSFFGGLDIRPPAILGQLWVRVMQDVLLAWPTFLSGVAGSERRPPGTSPGELLEWQAALSRSAFSDPLWHARWTIDVQRQWARLLATMGRTRRDPRVAGLVRSG